MGAYKPYYDAWLHTITIMESSLFRVKIMWYQQFQSNYKPNTRRTTSKCYASRSFILKQLYQLHREMENNQIYVQCCVKDLGNFIQFNKLKQEFRLRKHLKGANEDQDSLHFYRYQSASFAFPEFPFGWKSHLLKSSMAYRMLNSNVMHIKLHRTLKEFQEITKSQRQYS